LKEFVRQVGQLPRINSEV